MGDPPIGPPERRSTDCIDHTQRSWNRPRVADLRAESTYIHPSQVCRFVSSWICKKFGLCRI